MKHPSKTIRVILRWLPIQTDLSRKTMRLYPTRFWIVLWLLVPLWIIYITGCSDAKTPVEHVKLVQVNQGFISVGDFDKAIDKATADFPSGMQIDNDTMVDIRLRLLNQFAERLILIERAKELKLEITEVELENTIAMIKSDYPKGEFERVLLEQAVSYQQWKKELRIRLLMEKVVDHELDSQIQISPQEISAVYEQYYATEASDSDEKLDAAEIEATIIQQVRSSKKETMYKEWISSLEKRYNVSVNQEAWAKIIQGDIE